MVSDAGIEAAFFFSFCIDLYIGHSYIDLEFRSHISIHSSAVETMTISSAVVVQRDVASAFSPHLQSGIIVARSAKAGRRVSSTYKVTVGAMEDHSLVL